MFDKKLFTPNMAAPSPTCCQEGTSRRKKSVFRQLKNYSVIFLAICLAHHGVNSSTSTSGIFSAKLSSALESQPPPLPSSSSGSLTSPPELLLKLAKIRSSSGFNSDPSSATNNGGSPQAAVKRRVGVLPGLELVDVDFDAPEDGDMKAKKFVFRGNPFVSEGSSPQYSSVSGGGLIAGGSALRRRNDKTLSFPVRAVAVGDSESRQDFTAPKNYRELKAAKFYAPRNSYQALAGTRLRAGNEIQHNYAAPQQQQQATQSTSSGSNDEEQVFLPECASQQVCAAVHLRFNTSTPLCSCPGRFGERCSTSLSSDDGHSMGLASDAMSKQPLTLVKTCEPNRVIETCHNQKDWSLFALQNTRTRKAHYLIICSCPSGRFMEGPIEHAAPEYAQVPGIRIFGMMCVTGPLRKGKHTPSGAKDFERPSRDLWMRISNFLGHLYSWR